MKKTLSLLLLGVVLCGCATPAKKVARAPVPYKGSSILRFVDVYKNIKKKYVDSVPDETLLNHAIAGMYEEAGLEQHAPSPKLVPQGFQQMRLDRLVAAYNDIHARAPDIGKDRLWEAASHKMVSELDKSSSYLGVDAFNALKRPSSEKGAIGVGVREKEGHIFVVYLLPGTPSIASGLMPGDEIVEINGMPVSGVPLRDVERKLEGEPGSRVELLVKGGDQQRTLKVEREKIPSTNLECRVLDQQVLYLRPYRLTVGLSSALKHQVSAFKDEGRKLPDKVILDLRANGGGVLGAAVQLTDQFLASGTIADLQERAPGKGESHKATPGGGLEGTEKVVVLVDKWTAAGAELIAAALKDHQRASIIGEPTNGYGTVQQIFSIRYGGALKLTKYRIFRPSGRPLSEGVMPDIRVKEAEDYVMASSANEAACPGAEESTHKLTYDTVLRRALGE